MKNKEIRILHIIRHMNMGGAENFIMNLYRNINKEKIQFDFLVNDKGLFDDEIKQMGGNIYYMKYITEIGQIKYVKELKKFFKDNSEYDIIHSHLDQVSGIILETANSCNIHNRIAHSHNTKNTNNFVIKLYKKYLQSKINKNATHYFACGEDAAKWLYKEQADKSIIIPNAIDLKRFEFNIEQRKKIRKELNIDDNTIVVGQIGRFAKQKNHKFLIQIFYEYQKMNRNTKLILIGDGELKEKIKKQVKEDNIESKVIFMDNRLDIENMYSVFDLLLFPSLFEGISLVMIEAQATGLTILCSNTIDSKTNVTNTMKFMDLKCTAKDWAKRIDKMEKERYIENNNIIKDTNYNIKKLASYMEKLYENMILD